MDLGYDTLAALPYLREQAESRFTETWAVERDGTTKDANDVDVPSTTTVYSDVPGQFKPQAGVYDTNSAGQFLAVQQPTVKVAVGAVPGARVGDFFRCTASTSDAELIGRRFCIKGVPSSGQVTAHRFPVTEVS